MGQAQNGRARGHTHPTYLMLMLRSMLLLLLLTAAAAPLPCKQTMCSEMPGQSRTCTMPTGQHSAGCWLAHAAAWTRGASAHGTPCSHH